MEEQGLPLVVVVDERIKNLPPGIWFAPSDEELIAFYLKRKVGGQGLPCGVVKNENVYKYHPQQLARVYEPSGLNELQKRERAWFFFTPRERKHPMGSLPNRSVDQGFWKATGTKQKILGPSNEVIGCKRSLAFWNRTQTGSSKTSWMMKEYTVEESMKPVSEGERNMTLDDDVLCKIYYSARSNGGTAARSEGSPSEPAPLESRRFPHEVTEEEIKNLPPGFRFVPSDEELITYYLHRKVCGEVLPCGHIKCDDVYQYHPRGLTEVYETNGLNEQNGEPAWLVFTPRERKYPKGSRPRRTAVGGFWKSCEADQKILGPGRSVVGLKKTLVFCSGTKNSWHKTNWMMKEYKLEKPKMPASQGEHNMTLDKYVLCKIYRTRRNNGNAAGLESSSSESVPLESGSFPMPLQMLPPSAGSTTSPIQEQAPAIMIEQEADTYDDPIDYFTDRQPPPLPDFSCCCFSVSAQEQPSSPYLMSGQWLATDFVVDRRSPMTFPPLGFMVGSGGTAVVNSRDLWTPEVPSDRSDLSVHLLYDEFDEVAGWLVSPPPSPPAAGEVDPSDKPSTS